MEISAEGKGKSNEVCSSKKQNGAYPASKHYEQMPMFQLWKVSLALQFLFPSVQQHVGPLHPHLAVEDKTPDSEDAETETPLVTKRKEEDGKDPNEGGLGKNLGGGGGGGGAAITTAAVSVTNQPVTTAPLAQPIRWRSNLGQHSKQMKCPHCYKQIYTKVTYKSDDCTYFAAGLCCICCCCFIPFCLRELKAAHHFCPMCQVYIGSY